MGDRRTSLELFSLGDSIDGVPEQLSPATFAELRAREVQEIERWLKATPDLMGEPLKVVASQFAGFDKTQDRLDLLALDANAKLVVIEIKRDHTAGAQDLQALRYAAYVATLTADQVVELYVRYERIERGRELSGAAALSELEDFVETAEGIANLDEDERPRLLLVAAGFPVGVTNTALWLSRNFEFDIKCVQLTPYEVAGEVLIASSILIPLPESADFEVRLKEKQRRRAAHRGPGDRVDFDLARAFIDAIPVGRWAAYGDVAAAAGAARGAQAIGSWLAREEDVPSNAYRVLRRKGEVSGGWAASSDKLPSTAADVRARLAAEGVVFDEAGRASQSLRWRAEDWERSLADNADSGTPA